MSSRNGLAIPWEAVEDEAREDGNVLSFFEVIEESGGSRDLSTCFPIGPVQRRLQKGISKAFLIQLYT